MEEFDLDQFGSILAEYVPQGRSGLLPALQAAQKFYGYLPEPVAAETGRLLGVPLADVYGVIEFYALLTTQPAGRKIFRVCEDPVCGLHGGDEVQSALCRGFGVEPGQISAGGDYQVESSPCLGLCNHAPALLANDTPLFQASPQRIDEIVSAQPGPQDDFVGGSLHILTANCCSGAPTPLDAYQDGGGYVALRKALAMPPQAVIAELKAAGLLGRGGAAFPTGSKWESVAAATGPTKYVVVNADESEPGTFKDRILLEIDPHLLLEGMIIAAYSVGAHSGYIYVRGEYARAAASLVQAIRDARQAGLVGQNILNSGFDFELELRQGAGAYICGEETALFESIEGKRGFPRMKPPYPSEHGLFGKPTLINNVETLCNLPYIVTQGSAAFRQYGTPQSPGPKLFCVSGDVVQPGLYEAPLGVTLRELLYDMAGGIPNGRPLGAILLGGAAGAFAGPVELDLPLTFEDLRRAGLTLGSGAVMVFDNTRDLREVMLRLGRFFAHESCGKCYPCQMGTQRQFEILGRLANHQALPGDAERLADVGWTMTDASLCSLGQTAATAVLSALQRWPELFSPQKEI